MKFKAHVYCLSGTFDNQDLCDNAKRFLKSKSEVVIAIIIITV